MNIEQAIIQVLRDAKKPLHVDTITRRIRRMKLYKFRTATPAASVGARIYMSLKKDANTCFIQTAPAVFALKETPEQENQPTKKSASEAARKAWATRRAKLSADKNKAKTSKPKRIRPLRFFIVF